MTDSLLPFRSRRGYRDVMHRAALNEAAAAGVLALSGWREAMEAAGDGDGAFRVRPDMRRKQGPQGPQAAGAPLPPQLHNRRPGPAGAGVRGLVTTEQSQWSRGKEPARGGLFDLCGLAWA
jgi:hypothetical protein